jgi:hypothetical protein
MQPEREHFSGNTKLNIITKSRLAILVTHHSAIDKHPGEDYTQVPTYGITRGHSISTK